MENNYCGMYKTSASKFIPHDIHIKLDIELIFFLYKLDIRDDFNLVYHYPCNVLHHFEFRYQQL